MGNELGIDASEFFSGVVSPFLREFESNRSNVRRAYGAVWALDSFASHIFYTYREVCNIDCRDDIEFKKLQLVPSSVDFRLVKEVANATKHATRWGSNAEVISSCEVKKVNMIGWAAWMAGADGKDWGEQVIIHSEKHRFRPLLPIVQRAEQFLVGKKDEYERCQAS